VTNTRMDRRTTANERSAPASCPKMGLL